MTVASAVEVWTRQEKVSPEAIALEERKSREAWFHWRAGDRIIFLSEISLLPDEELKCVKHDASKERFDVEGRLHSIKRKLKEDTELTRVESSTLRCTKRQLEARALLLGHVCKIAEVTLKKRNMEFQLKIVKESKHSVEAEMLAHPQDVLNRKHQQIRDNMVRARLRELLGDTSYEEWEARAFNAATAATKQWAETRATAIERNVLHGWAANKKQNYQAKLARCATVAGSNEPPTL